MEATPANPGSQDLFEAGAGVDYPAGTESEQKPIHSWLILIHINSDERGVMTSVWACASSALIRKGQFGRPSTVPAFCLQRSECRSM